ncbi:MAG TPA: hypothetical protein VKA94_11850 [Hyphomicrobiales bacterium]|nr:hypothetical protein [Hyphomicrobiales bacterium]
MKIYALAAFLAFSVVGLAAEAAKADYLCCRSEEYQDEFVTHHFHVVKDATVFGCDGYHCETNIVLKYGLNVKARCRNGWCEIRSIPLKNVWVLESCLERLGYGAHHRNRHRYEPEYGYDTQEDDEFGRD